MSKPAEPRRPPLGLPRGSIRALLTLLIVAVVLTRLARGQRIEPLWTETLMIALAHYFTTRRFITLPPDLVRRLEAEGFVEAEAYPLYLPRYAIRVVVVLSFVALAVYLYIQARLFEGQALPILGVVFAYLLGIVARSALAWWTRGRPSKGLRGWEDVKAAVVLLVLLLTAGTDLLGRGDLLPRPLRDATLGLVLFYFGSR